MPRESAGVARFAAETSFQSDRAATAASRVSHAFPRLREGGRPTIQHGLERWLVRRVGRHIPSQTVAHAKLLTESRKAGFCMQRRAGRSGKRGTVPSERSGCVSVFLEASIHHRITSGGACGVRLPVLRNRGRGAAMAERFACYLVEKLDGKKVVSGPAQRELSDLPPGEVLIRIQWSSLNYKDALAARGHPGVAKQFPHIPGVDMAGTVVESQDCAVPHGPAGDRLCLRSGGRSMGWLVGVRPRTGRLGDAVAPRSTLRESMVIGTAGFTSALSCSRCSTMALNQRRAKSS